MTDETGPVAGWYPDPAGGPLVRWWSGADWTTHTREVPPKPPTFESTPTFEPSAAVEPETPYVPFASRRAALDTETRPAPVRNRHAFIGRGLSILAVIVSIITVIVIDIGFHVVDAQWSMYATYTGLILAPGLALSGIVFSAVGLAQIRTRGNGGVASAGLVLGILFLFAPFWVGIAVGVIVGITGR